MEEEVLTGISQDNQQIGDVQQDESEQPEESSTEANTTEETPSSEGVEETPNTQNDTNVPFHQDPKIQDYIQRQVETRAESIREELKGEINSIKTQTAPAEPVAMPSWFVKLAGDTPEAQEVYKEYQAATQAEKMAWKQEAITDYQKSVEAQTNQQVQDQERITTQIAEMASEGEQFDENALRKFLLDYHNDFGTLPVLADGRTIDMRKGLQLMKRMTPDTNPGKAEARQKVAEAVSPSPKGESTATKVDSSFLKKGWGAI